MRRLEQAGGKGSYRGAREVGEETGTEGPSRQSIGVGEKGGVVPVPQD